MSLIETIIDVPAEHERKVCGQFDCYLKKIERTLHVSMIARDGEIKIIGPDHAVKKAKSVFSTLIELSKRGEEVGEQNVDYALSLSFTENDDQILEIDKDIICRTIMGKPVKPKTLGQKHYVDSIRKKITVVEGVAAGLGRTNLTPRCVRVETLTARFAYVVSRAVTAMSEFVNWVWNRLERGQRGTLPNGILYLKGGDLAEELALTGKRWDVYDIARFFEEEFFETKKVVYTPKK